MKKLVIYSQVVNELYQNTNCSEKFGFNSWPRGTHKDKNFMRINTHPPHHQSFRMRRWWTKWCNCLSVSSFLQNPLVQEWRWKTTGENKLILY